MSAAAQRTARQDAALHALSANVPYIQFLGISFERRGDELTSMLKFSNDLIGNPLLPALHGGATGAFLEITAIFELSWVIALERIDAGGAAAEDIEAGRFKAAPRTVDITFDYLRSGKPRDTYARATILRRGRRVANIRVEAWQEERSRPIAAAHGHFLLPDPQ